MLFLDKMDLLTSNKRLCSGYINKVMLIVQHQFPEIGGLNCVTLGQHIYFSADHWKKSPANRP